ncbi:MAG: hypothetical protein GX660_22340 [Clostridiaceae bacterium]|nr:hypothetical protein [Clostridiaceae bacterium]
MNPKAMLLAVKYMKHIGHKASEHDRFVLDHARDVISNYYQFKTDVIETGDIELLKKTIKFKLGA